jgi:hypothetical protein
VLTIHTNGECGFSGDVMVRFAIPVAQLQLGEPSSIDLCLWAGVACCTLWLVRRRHARQPSRRAFAFATAAVLTSLALVTA